MLPTLDSGGGLGPAGLAVDAPGNVYTGLVTFDPATQGVYRIAPGGSGERLPGTGQIGLANALAFDKNGNLYVTDTIRGAVWRIPRGGSATLWIEHPLLAGDGSAGLGFTIGANGIAYRQGWVYVAVTEGARVVRIPVQGDGGAGSPGVVAEGTPLYGVDGITLDVHGDVWAPVIAQSTLVKVSAADGTMTTVATAADGLDFASSAAFGTGRGDRKSLFLVNFAIGPLGGSGPGRAPGGGRRTRHAAALTG